MMDDYRDPLIRPTVDLRRMHEAREAPIGFGPLLMVGHTTKTFRAVVRYHYRPTGLVIPRFYDKHLVASYFMVEDIKVGGVSQFVTDDPVPARVFLERKKARQLYPMGFDMCPPQGAIELTVTNVTHDHRWFLAFMPGTVLR